MRPGEADDLVNDPTGLPEEIGTDRTSRRHRECLRFFRACSAGNGGSVVRIPESKATSNRKGGMPMRRELLNQGLMYGLVSLFVFIVAPLVT